MIAIVDYGLGNLGSIANMLQKIGVKATITANHDAIASATKLILPGVGAFDSGMENLRRLGLDTLLSERLQNGAVPTLGICLGAQLMTQSSEEGKRPGLGWIQAKTIRFCSRQPVANLKIPHMGWNDVAPQKPNPLFTDMFPNPRFYFVHSYHFLCEQPEDVLAVSNYGYDFACAFSRGHLFGVQFHPEKSHKFGMRLLQNFAAIPTPSA